MIDMKKIFYIIILFIPLLFSSNITAFGLGDFFDPRVEISNFIVPDSIEVGEEFNITVTIENHKIFWIKTSIQVNLLDGMLNNIIKDIADKKNVTIKSRDLITIDIPCKIREGDSDWYKERYNLEVVVFKNYLLPGGRIQLDNSIQGIHLITNQTKLNEKLIEKEKLRITNVFVQEKIEREDENKFNTTVFVINEGCIDFDVWVRVDFIEKPSAIPDLEEYIDLKSLGSFRKEIGRSPETKEILLEGKKRKFTIPCTLRDTESRKETFNIEAVLFVNIDGMEYKVDSSTIYGIYHDQPICRDEFCIILAVAAIFIILITIGLIVFIIRIIYPMYYRKSDELKKEMVKVRKGKSRRRRHK